MRHQTEQEQFWQGEFGNEYTHRNEVLPTARKPFFEAILSKTNGIQSICEFGANKGHNLQAIHELNAELNLTGVELNEIAFEQLKQLPFVDAAYSSIQDFQPKTSFDLIFTCGVLIHINPDDLLLVYDKIYRSSKKYILINEYYNPSPVELEYRGHSGKLFKRDFAGELLDQFSQDLIVIDYGFLWKRVTPVWDNTTWFLLKKTA